MVKTELSIELVFSLKLLRMQLGCMRGLGFRGCSYRCGKVLASDGTWSAGVSKQSQSHGLDSRCDKRVNRGVDAKRAR